MSRIITKSDRRFTYATVIPTAVIIIIVGLIPVLYSFNLSLQNYDIIKIGSKYIGFANYIKLLTQPRFIHALVFTFCFALAATILEIIVGFILAYILADKKIISRYSSGIRTAMMVPYIVAPVVVSYIYKTLIYDPSFGYLNYLLRLLNLPQFIIIKGTINPIISILVMEIILRTPFVTLILYAGITSVPDSILEASEMDGAHLKQRIFNIIIPFIRPVMVVAFVFRFMDALKMFDEVYVLTRGGPGNITENISLFATDQGFTFHHISYSAASTMIFLVIVIIIMNIILKATRFNED